MNSTDTPGPPNLSDMGMRCNLCGTFSVPSPDKVSVAIMQEHLYREHDIGHFRPVLHHPARAEDPDSGAW